jgi:hypothetical protein
VLIGATIAWLLHAKKLMDKGVPGQTRMDRCCFSGALPSTARKKLVRAEPFDYAQDRLVEAWDVEQLSSLCAANRKAAHDLISFGYLLLYRKMKVREGSMECGHELFEPLRAANTSGAEGPWKAKSVVRISSATARLPLFISSST